MLIFFEMDYAVISEFVHNRKVEFSDTDMAGIMHFSRFFIFMESAEHAFFRSLGFSIHTDINGKRYGWPRIHVACDFRRPLRFEDDVEIRLMIHEITDRTIFYRFTFIKLNGDQPEEVATGEVKTICVTFNEETGMKSATIPPEITAKITEHQS
jgi:YbgC/YbaW family acyl-CoA thioester hydrolase